MRKTTLGELGTTLPIGRVQGNQLVKDFQLRPFLAEIDFRLEDLRRERPGMSLGETTTILLALLLERWGGEEVPEREPARRNLLRSSYFADVLYANAWARLESDGEGVDIRLPCAACGEIETVNFDLRTLDVQVAESPEELEKVVELDAPVEIQEQKATQLKLHAVRWSDLEKHEGSLRRAVLAGGIVGAAGANGRFFPARLSSAQLGRLPRRDAKRLEEEILEVSRGAEFGWQASCPYCKAPIQAVLRWDYDTFFG